MGRRESFLTLSVGEAGPAVAPPAGRPTDAHVPAAAVPPPRLAGAAAGRPAGDSDDSHGHVHPIRVMTGSESSESPVGMFAAPPSHDSSVRARIHASARTHTHAHTHTPTHTHPQAATSNLRAELNGRLAAAADAAATGSAEVADGRACKWSKEPAAPASGQKRRPRLQVV